MKYLIKNRKTGEETLCEKVEVDGFDYYIGNEWTNSESCFHYNHNLLQINNHETKGYRKVVATTNPSLDLPVVIDEVEGLARKEFPNNGTIESGYLAGGYKIGYQAAKETYSYTKGDMVEFATWYQEENTEKKAETYFGFSDLDMLAKWQEQRAITINVK